jgi:hypothetical protein
MYVWAWLLAATLIGPFVAPAVGAEIRHASPKELLRLNGAQVILEGDIEIGDYDKLLGLIDEDCRDYSCTAAIFLASPGGDLIEAMKIGRLVRQRRLETHIPSDLPPRYRPETEGILRDPETNYLRKLLLFHVCRGG